MRAPVERRLIPLLELTTASKLRGAEEVEGPRLRGRPQVYLTPGVNAQLRPEATLGLGVQVPLTAARTADYTLFLSPHWGF